MEFNEAKEKVLMFLEKKTELAPTEQYLLLNELTKEKYKETLAEVTEEYSEEDDEFSDFDEEPSDDYEPESEPVIKEVTKTRPVPVIKEVTAKIANKPATIADLDNDI